VATLKIGDIDNTRMLIRVEQGKGRKDHNALQSPQPLELLRLWWREGKRRSVTLPKGWLFPGRNALEPISTRHLNRAVHEAAETAGIKKRVTPHTLRRTFATHLLGQDVDIAQRSAVMPFRVGWVHRSRVTFLSGEKNVFSNGDRHTHFLHHLPLTDAVPCGIKVRDRGRRRACRCGTDRGGIDHPDDLSSRRQPGAVRTLYFNL
jgi:hypothetical protein